MVWKQLAIPFGQDYGPIQDAAADLLMSGAPKDLALFVRTTPDYAENILLLALPDVLRGAFDLFGEWLEIVGPGDEGWTLLAGHSDAPAVLGVKAPQL